VWNPHDPEVSKSLAEELVQGAGSYQLYHSFVFDILRSGNTVEGVVIVNKSGVQGIRAKVIVDCTGDADVAALAGVKCETEDSSSMQPMTVGVRMTGIDWPDWPNKPEGFKELFQENCEKYGTPVGQRGDGILTLVERGECFINKTRIPGDATKIQDVTNAELEGRRQAFELLEWYRRHVPGFEKARIIQTGSQIGVRETRRILGEYYLTKEDVLGCRHFDDGIARGHYWVDLHRPHSSETIYEFLPDGQYYNIPYRSLLPKGVDGLIVAGRCISGSHGAAGSYRIMSHCMAVGEAAGSAAALSVSTSKEPREVDVHRLRETLTAQGALV
jgi:FAD dependent oxidoreductase